MKIGKIGTPNRINKWNVYTFIYRSIYLSPFSLSLLSQLRMLKEQVLGYLNFTSESVFCSLLCHSFSICYTEELLVQFFLTDAIGEIFWPSPIDYTSFPDSEMLCKDGRQDLGLPAALFADPDLCWCLSRLVAWKICRYIHQLWIYCYKWPAHAVENVVYFYENA